LLTGAALGIGVLVVACCGGGGHDSGHDDGNAKVAPGARVIKVDARSYEFDPDEITIDKGEDVAIQLTSEDTFHDFEVAGKHVVGAEGDETAKGGLRINKPGKYTFFCSVPGHDAGGMEGTLIVRG
jgi:plastocyanin